MKREIALVALLASACTTMEPNYTRPDPAIPASWPVGDPYLAQAEVGLPVLTYQQVFQDPRLQTLIARALVNNRDLMAAASNIAAARQPAADRQCRCRRHGARYQRRHVCKLFRRHQRSEF